MYWIPLYEILEDRGFEVYLVNARHTKNLPGRKSDVQESQWLLKLHTYGLLSNSLQPPAEIRVLRTLGDKPQDCWWAVSHHQTVSVTERWCNTGRAAEHVLGSVAARHFWGPGSVAGKSRAKQVAGHPRN